MADLEALLKTEPIGLTKEALETWKKLGPLDIKGLKPANEALSSKKSSKN
jgi:hypothetical protein